MPIIRPTGTGRMYGQATGIQWIVEDIELRFGPTVDTYDSIGYSEYVFTTSDLVVSAEDYIEIIESHNELGEGVIELFEYINIQLTEETTTSSSTEASYAKADDISEVDKRVVGGAGSWVMGYVFSSIYTEMNEMRLEYGTGDGQIISFGETSERLTLSAGQSMTYGPIPTPVDVPLTRIDINKYQVPVGDPGSGTIEYKTGSTWAACEGASWTEYTVPFTSSGWLMVKLSR